MFADFPIHVRSLATEPGLSDIREIVRSPNYWPWLWSALALLAVAGFLFWLRRRLAKPPVPQSAELPQTQALRRLRELRENEPKLEAERFTLEVSSILRTYLEEALDLPAPEQTSEEFLRDLRAQPWLTPELLRDLETFVQRSDLVKFARQDLASAEREHLLRCAESVVSLDLKQPEPEPEPAVS